MAGVQLAWRARNNRAPIISVIETHGVALESARSRTGSVHGFLSAKESVGEPEPLAPAPARSRQARFGLPTLDEADFLYPGTVTGIAARPGAGKTALGLQAIVATAMDQELPAAYLSLEMDRVELFQRILAHKASVNYRVIRRRQISHQDRGKCEIEMREIRASPIYTDDRPVARIEDFGAALRKLHRDRPELCLGILDYLGLVQLDNPRDPHNVRLGMVTRNAVRIARELKIAIVLLIQLGRRNEQEKRTPQLSDLADSDVIGRDCYSVLGIDRRLNDEGVLQQEGHIVTLKHRGGDAALRVPIRFVGHFQRFQEITDREEPPF